MRWFYGEIAGKREEREREVSGRCENTKTRDNRCTYIEGDTGNKDNRKPGSISRVSKGNKYNQKPNSSSNSRLPASWLCSKTDAR